MAYHEQNDGLANETEPKPRDMHNNYLTTDTDNDVQHRLDLPLNLSPALSPGFSNTIDSVTTPPEGGLVAWMAGVISGRLTDAGYFRITTFVGAILVILGTFMTSLGQTYWQILLAQGVCTGLGNGFLLTPMMTLITTYFRSRLALVMGIAACGSTTGGLIYPSMARTLLPTVGFGWTMRAMGFIQLGTFAIALACGKPRPTPKKSAPLVDWSVFKEPEFTLYLIGSFLVSNILSISAV
ncbi:hypothetical protein ACHAP8_010689 [Fusarium lateritium]